MAAPSLLFIHRSVGQNLIDDAGIYKLVEAAGMPFILNDYNQNVDQLREGGGVPQHAGWSFPGGDTTPADYALLFSQKHLTANGPMLDIILAYDIIAIKSCFPNTRITSDEMLAAHQQSYERIINFFQDKPRKKLVILTSPPLIPILTLPPFARRARKLANWLAGTDFSPNIFVFDLFNRLAVPEGKLQANTLRRGYRRHFPFDSHPSAKAAVDIAPELIAFFTRVAQA